MATDLERQIVDELAQVFARIRPLTGWNPADDRVIAARAPEIAAALTDPDESTGIAADLMACLWPHSDPPGDWWRTPLGMAVAGTGWGSESVSMSAAASMIGVTGGRVTQLSDAGTLTRTRGGVTRASVTARIATT